MAAVVLAGLVLEIPLTVMAAANVFVMQDWIPAVFAVDLTVTPIHMV